MTTPLDAVRDPIVCPLCSDSPGAHPHVGGRPVDAKSGEYLDHAGEFVSEMAAKAERERKNPAPPKGAWALRPGHVDPGPLPDSVYEQLGLVPPRLRKK